MTNLVLNVSRQPEWIHAFQRIKAELGWNPAYWITYEQNHDDVGEAFPSAIRHRRLDLNRVVVLPEFGRFQSLPLSEETLTRAQPYLITALEILNRFDLGYSMSHGERTRIVHKLLAYWFGIIEHCSIDMGIFSTPPHGLGNYLLYAALKLSGKPVRIFISSAVDNLTFVADDIDSIPLRMIESYQAKLASEEPVSLSPKVAESLRTVREAEPSFKPWYVHDAVFRESKRQEFLENLERSIDTISIPSQFLPERPIAIEQTPFRKRRGEKGAKAVERAFKIPGRPIGDRMITLQEYEDYRDWAMVQKIGLRKHYEAICTPASEIRNPFVYFGLHYQPERTTCPDGGHFSDQYLCAALLSHAIPGGWDIVVKEHPNQFRYTSMGETGRWAGYYDDFLALGNVRFVPFDTPSIELIDRSQAVATVTGAMGWEALVRGRPALHFGFAWYGFCRGATRIKSIDDARSAFGDAPLKSPTQREVEAFAATLEEHARSVITTPTMEGAIDSTEGMADEFFDLLAAT